MVSWLASAWEYVQSKILTNQKKLTATGGILIGIICTLAFKDIYPDLELSFQRRLRRVRSSKLPHTPPQEGDYLRLEDHTRTASVVNPGDSVIRAKNPAPAIREGLEGLIGNTPLIKLPALSAELGVEILVKCEFLNGAGNSPKDRVALSMIKHAEEESLLVPGRGDTIYEGTVGSTGISLAAVARSRGYRAHICMPSDQSPEKSSLLLKLGATVERVPPAGITDPDHFVNTARRRAANHTSSSDQAGRGFFADQFENTANYLAHFETTGPEIYRQTDGQLDAFVAGAGTGGTLSGVAMFLKPRVQGLNIVLADPQGSGLYNWVKYGVMFSPTEAEGTRRRHQVDSVVEGIGLTRQTGNFLAGANLIDDAVRVDDDTARLMARWLVQKEGLFIGASSAVNVTAAAIVGKRLAEKEGKKGGRIVTVVCDSGTRHLSRFWKGDGSNGEESLVELGQILDQAK
ncbi:PALP-domain-containing protein [Polychaeton citri CBS 116435]|uniref:Cysteine synthase 2 n=1 Tax=Polychaeton citri CBS 116435 TaxID=1314669 RepID=A0A9P4Q3H7_9PEZI|nr:PALP-domain-containing protein [Polychaeton citri CBS 116435]